MGISNLFQLSRSKRAVLRAQSQFSKTQARALDTHVSRSKPAFSPSVFSVAMSLEELDRARSVSSDQSSFLGGVELRRGTGRGSKAVTSAGVGTAWVVGTGVGTERVAILPSPLTRALMDFFQPLIGVSLGILCPKT